MTTLQLLINGLALGAAYALVALGFVLVLNATSAVNFAQGDLVMAGGLLAVALAPLIPLPGIALLPVVLVAMAALGLVLALAAYLPLRRSPPVAVFISTIAVGIILQNGASVLFGPEPRAAPPLLSGGTVDLGGLVVAEQSLAIIAVAGLLIAGQQWLFARTQLGRRLRATAQDPEMARACGVPVTAMILVTFALGTAYAGAAGLLLANRYFVTPTAGGDLILKAYIAVTIGGWGSVPGAVVGALLIALFEVGVSSVLSYPVALGLLYAALLVILLARPQGLFGEAARRRA
ncbi:branched-chain amino acid ABC transporter permease [Azospirillum rugosum]|uniref:Branched-chain amino acid transport system permease protein n=1 Tax=Azospirillum rugosum TaxID=416170 RepID=A0ABS4SNB3_9PROT|nr:branched-chain amino acid ABC transporter permease [Azospirillum rugosum]MBP2293573.1 branched-chain amino acid transport system permease protein [Azospirillum rugosum]MDQ0529252.1 branched-chain amino acid transport system permease protein [Azospirillum rugosum]